MDAITPISNAQRLLPNPARHAAAPRPDAAEAPASPRPASVSAPAVWTLNRETAQAACAAQMIAAPRRGLKADACERTRYARAYAARREPPGGLMLKETA